MKNIKFYALALLLGAGMSVFTSCDKDDDDNNSGNSNGVNTTQVEQMKGGDIVGTWILDESKSATTINGAASVDALGDYANYINVSSMVNLLGDIVTFTEDLKVNTASQKGSYTTNVENLTVTFPLSETTNFTIEGGADLSTLIAAKNPSLANVVSATLNSFSYTAANNVLTIQVYATVSADIEALSSLKSTNASSSSESSKLILPIVAKFVYNLQADSDDNTIIGSWVMDESKTAATINGAEASSFLSQFGVSNVNIGEVVNVLGDTVTFNADSTVVAGDKKGTFHTEDNALSFTLTTADGTATYQKGSDVKSLVASNFGAMAAMVSDATLNSLTYIVDNKHLTVKLEIGVTVSGMTLPINASFEYDLE